MRIVQKKQRRVRQAYLNLDRRIVITQCEDLAGNPNGWVECWKLSPELRFKKRKFSYKGSLQEALNGITNLQDEWGESVKKGFVLVTFKDSPFDFDLGAVAIMEARQKAVQSKTDPPKQITI